MSARLMGVAEPPAQNTRGDWINRTVETADHHTAGVGLGLGAYDSRRNGEQAEKHSQREQREPQYL